MDKRYLLIIVIIIVCCFNMFIISNFSDIIGSASIDCNNYTFSAPSGFALYDSTQKYILIHDSNSGMNIYLYDSLSSSETYKNKIKDIQDNGNDRLLKKGTLDVDGIKVYSIYYQRNDSGQYRSTFYFNKFGNDFRILITDFDYESDYDKTIKYAEDVITSLRINHKVVG